MTLYCIAAFDVNTQTNTSIPVEALTTEEALLCCIRQVCHITEELPSYSYVFELKDFAKTHGYILSDPCLIPDNLFGVLELQR